MGRIAVFVDAGYLFAQGSAVLTGAKVVRTRITLDEAKVVDLLAAFAEVQAGQSGALLRIYWYDASPGRFLNAGHVRLGEIDNVKLRLGVINDFNQQKGVDSLLIADLIQLGHNRAIDSAVVLSGDEDLRVGVQVAQGYGIRVHLLGFQSATVKASQSQSLVAEADTRTLWDEKRVSSFLSIAPVQKAPVVAPAASPGVAVQQDASDGKAHTSISATFAPSYGAFYASLTSLVEGFTEKDTREILTVYDAGQQIEYAYDRKLLKIAREALGRELDFDEKRFVRRCLIDSVRVRVAQVALDAAVADGLPIID